MEVPLSLIGLSVITEQQVELLMITSPTFFCSWDPRENRTVVKISDKRVSRSHAVLEVVDDKLRIKPMHVNPCFYQSSHTSKFVPLERNEWSWLQSGDCFSFLPDQYCFRVLAEHSTDEATLRNSQAFDEDCGISMDSPSSTSAFGTEADLEEPSCSSTSKPTSSEQSEKCEKRREGTISNMCTVRCKDHLEQSKPAQRKRILPEWMLQNDFPIQSLPVPPIKAGKKRLHIAVNSSRETVENSTTKKQTNVKKSKDHIEDIMKKEAAEELEVFPGTSSSIAPGTAELGNSCRCVVDNEEEEMDIGDHTPELSPKTVSDAKNSSSGNAATKHRTLLTTTDDLSQSPGSPKTTQQTQKCRTPCMYAERCYRKNPTHFQEHSHPGDSDYHTAVSQSQDDHDDRPECPYGTDCYRKNPQHKLEYKHTKPPGRRLRKRATKKAKSVLDDDSDHDGESNEYDLDDSFIDDDEEEEEDYTDEDSEWMPESEEKDSEDMNVLLKEAKKFVKGKR